MKIHTFLLVTKMCMLWSKDWVSYTLVLITSRIPIIVCAGRFIPTRRTPGVSTSELLERIVRGYRQHDLDEKLIKMGRAELRMGENKDDSASSGS